jgi:hypothetical protein
VNGGFDVSQTRKHMTTAAIVSLVAVLFAAPALAGPFTQLQVLLPGETAAPGTVSGKTGTPNPQVANMPFTITVRACDSQWNTVTSITDVMQILATDQSATLPANAQLVNGTRTFSVTLNAAGSFTIFAHDQTDGTIPDGASTRVSVAVLQGFRVQVPGAGDHGQDQTCGSAFRVTVTALDPANNTVQGFNGTVSMKELTNFGDGPTSPTQVTLSAGTWTGNVIVYRADPTVNRGGNVYVWVPAFPSKDGTSAPFNVRPGPFTRVQIVLPGQNPLPGSASGLVGTASAQVSGNPFNVNVIATDTWWNQVSSGQTVNITSTDPNGSTPVSGSLNNGYRTFAITLRTVGNQTLSVVDQQNGGILGMTSDPFPVLPNNTNHFTISTISSPQTAGVPVPVTIRAVDAAGNTIPTYGGDAILVANTGSGSMSPELVTFASGIWSGNMVFRGAGANVQFTIQDFTYPPHAGTSNVFQVNAGPLAGVQVLLPGETALGGTATGKSGTPTGQSAGNVFNVTVRAVDAYWNLVPGVTDSISLGSSDPFAAMPAETVLVNGQTLVPTRLAKSGPQVIWAHDITQPSTKPDTSSTVNITGGAFAKVLLLAPGESPAPGTATGRTGTPTDQSINYAFTLTALATDAWWNPVSGVTDVVHLTSTDAQATLQGDTPMTDGRADLTVRLASGGYQLFTVSDVTQPSKAGSSTQVRGISSGFHLVATANPDSAKAGQPFTLTVQVVNDAGSVIQEVNSFITVQVQNASTRAPGRGTLLTTQFQLLQGQRSVSETYTFAEPIVLVVRDDAGNAPGITGVVNVSPGPPARIALTSAPAWVTGNKHATVTAQLTDAFGNGNGNQPMTFVRASGTGTLTPIDSLTDASGFARADFLSPRIPEHDLINASSGPISQQIDIETALVDPNAPTGYVSNFPNPFHPPFEPTTIAYKLSDDATVTLRIFTLTGQLVRRVVFDRATPGGMNGNNAWDWDGKNGDGTLVASGGYIMLLEAQGTGGTINVIRRKIAVVR